MSQRRLAGAATAGGLVGPPLAIAGVSLWVRPDLAPGVPGPTLFLLGIALLGGTVVAAAITSTRHRAARKPDPVLARRAPEPPAETPRSRATAALRTASTPEGVTDDTSG